MHNNIVIPQLQTVFFLVPKAANSSIKAAIRKHLGLSDAFATLHNGWRLCGPDGVPQGYKTVGVVRHPFDRLVSCYHNKIIGDGVSRIPWRGISWDEFKSRVIATPDTQADHHFRSQYCGFVSNGQMQCEHVFRFEDLPQAWDEIRAIVGDLPDLPHKNSTDHPDWREYDCSGLAERYADDFHWFNYTCETL